MAAGQDDRESPVAEPGVERQAVFWLIAGAVLVLLIGLLKEILLPFVTGAILAYCLNPAVGYLDRKGVPRTLSSALVILLLILLVVLAFVFLVPMIVTQAQQFIVALPGELEKLETLLENFARDNLGRYATEAQAAIDKAFASLTENRQALATWLAQSLWTQGKALFNFVSLMLVTPLLVFYLLVDWEPMLRKINEWLPRRHARSLRQLGADVNNAVGASVRGQGMVCLVLGTFYAIALSLIGLNYGLLIGVVTGIASFVPFVGWALGTIVATTVAILQYWPDVMPVILVAGVFLIGQTVDSAVLSPKIIGSRIGLHPVWLIFALIAFSYLFGLVGVLIAVPLAAAAGVIVRFALKAYLGSSVYTGRLSPPPPVSAAAPLPASGATSNSVPGAAE